MRKYATTVVMFVAVASSIPGCTSATQAVSRAATDVTKSMDVIGQRADEIDVETYKEPPDPKAIRELTGEIRKEATKTKRLAENIHQQVPRMDNKADGFFEQIMSTLQTLAWVGLGIVILVLLVATGALGGVRKLFGLIGAMIPSVRPLSIPKDDREDTTVLKKLDDGTMEPKEAIAYFRGKYPGISQAWSLQKEKPKPSSTPDEMPSSGSTTS